MGLEGKRGYWPAQGDEGCGRLGPLPHPHPIFSVSPLLSSYSWLCGPFPNGPLDHCSYLLAQVPHQCHPPDYSCPKHGCPGCSRSCQEEVTLKLLSLTTHLPWEPHCAMQLPSPSEEVQAQVWVTGKGVSLFDDVVFSIILKAS